MFVMNFAIKRRRNHRLETLFEIKNKIGFEKNKYLLQLLELLGAHCNFSSSEKLSRLGRKVCNAGVDQLGAEQQQHQNETRPPPSQTMVPP